MRKPAGRRSYVTDNEQRLDFRVHNADWVPIDFDGLKLMLRPACSPRTPQALEKPGFSNASKAHMARKMSGCKGTKIPELQRYAVLDIETTGLTPSTHEIIEIGAIIIENHRIESTYEALIRPEGPVPDDIQALTGLTANHLIQEGISPTEGLTALKGFIESLPVLSHNAGFDFAFLRAACERCGLPPINNPSIDTAELARRCLGEVRDYKLETLAATLNLPNMPRHRALPDCQSTMQLYEKLIKLGKP